MPRTRKTARPAPKKDSDGQQDSIQTVTQAEQTVQAHQSANANEGRPVSLQGAPGNVLWNDSDVNGNVAGIASIAYAAVIMLEAFVNDKASEDDREEAKKMLEHIGGSEKVNGFRNKVQQHVGTFVPVKTVFKNLFNEGR